MTFMALNPESCYIFLSRFFVIICMFARNLAAFTLVALIQFVAPLIGILRTISLLRFVCGCSRVFYLLFEFISVLCSLNLTTFFNSRARFCFITFIAVFKPANTLLRCWLFNCFVLFVFLFGWV